MIDFGTLSMTEIIRLQGLLQQELTRRFERHVALVFSDIAGSTPYFARFGDAAGRQLQQLHIDLLGKCLPARQGRIVDTAGDGAFLAFPSATAATEALIEFQQLVSRENATRARDHQLQVRIGMHWGPVLTDGVVVSGDAVNLAARVAASASIGEMRLTREVFQDLSATHRLNCRPLGPVELKGVARQVELLALEWRDRSMFPTLFRIEETRAEVVLPQQDIISFGRLREHEGTLANDVVLTLPDPLLARQISRWHFELRRFADGFHLRPLSDGATEVDGALIAKGQEVIIKPGSRIRVANVITLTFASPPVAGIPDSSDSTMVAGMPTR
jgi:class 3 adenylate cyclase